MEWIVEDYSTHVQYSGKDPDPEKTTELMRNNLSRVSLLPYPLNDIAPPLECSYTYSNHMLIDEQSEDKDDALVMFELYPAINTLGSIRAHLTNLYGSDSKNFMIDEWEGEKETQYETIRGNIETLESYSHTHKVHIWEYGAYDKNNIKTKVITSEFSINREDRVVRMSPGSLLRLTVPRPVKPCVFVLQYDAEGLIVYPEGYNAFFNPQINRRMEF